MGARLASVVGGELRETPDGLVVEFAQGAWDLGELYRALGAACISKQAHRVLVEAGDADSTAERTLRDAMQTVALAGVPLDFRLAVVATSPGIAAIYRRGQPILCAAGIAARVFETAEAARRWLYNEDYADFAGRLN